MSEFWIKARPWLIWPWRAMLAAYFGVSLVLLVGDLANNSASADLVASLVTIRGLLSLGFCTLLVVRGYRSRAALLLAIIMLSAGGAALFAVTPNVPGFQPDFFPALQPVAGLLFIVMQMSLAYAFPVFGLVVSGGPYSRRQAWLVHGLGAALAAIIGAYMVGVIFLEIPTFIRSFSTFIIPYAIADQLSTYAVIAVNYRRNDAAGRNRLKIVLVAFVLALATSLSPLFDLPTWQHLAFALLRFVTLALLAYAVLKQRLVDMGFAVNRTLVYGAAAFTLLVTFGLLEYAAKSAIPTAWPDAGPFISAGIAVLLFLMFHRLHHWFEHHIERLFFSSWQQAEAALKRFVHSAGHYEQVPALCRDFTGELERFSGGAAAAIYLRGDGGGFELQAGELDGAAKSYAEDGRGFALMRTERKPIDLARADQPLPGALALPMLDQGRLLGFALVGAKPDGAHYRPDEIEILNWAVHQVGLDIRALHARLLEERVESLTGENRLLTNEKDRAIQERDRLNAEREGLMALLASERAAQG